MAASSIPMNSQQRIGHYPLGQWSIAGMGRTLCEWWSLIVVPLLRAGSLTSRVLPFQNLHTLMQDSSRSNSPSLINKQKEKL